MGVRALVGRLACPDGESLLVRVWLPEGPPRAVLMVSHGMAEHSGRYRQVAETLARDGWAVYAHDHRGHGGTAREPGRAGRFPARDGWNVVVEDLHRVRALVTRRHRGLPVFLLGHSMGSLIARDFAIRWSPQIDGLVVSGTLAPLGPRRRPSEALASVVVHLGGTARPSVLLDELSLGGYARSVPDARTDTDWLSRDSAEVDAYRADPWCGFTCSAGLFRDVLSGQVRVEDPGLVGLVRDGLPVLVTSGGQDPVGCGELGARRTAEQYRRAGVGDVTVRIWPGARHELLHETNRSETIGFVRDWLDAHLPS